jgi:hypothetical protein
VKPSDLTRSEVVERRIAEAPESVRGTLRRAFFGSASPRQAIKAMCLSCTGFDRAEVANCTGYSCPLWRYRPFQREVDAESTSTSPDDPA